MATLQLNHVARETDDVRRLAAFYEEVLGFERVASPNYPAFQVAWLRLPGTPGVALHIIERDPAAAPAAVAPGAAGAPPAQLPRRHHLAFSVADYDGFLAGLKARGTDVFEKTQPDGRTRQVFFFDPDGNGLEVTSSGTGDNSSLRI
uniref:VOC domain-containing protein n=1 Tax=Oryza meridionalis TaxID=40149 RepID=A0A0E0D469_9ORYZ